GLPTLSFYETQDTNGIRVVDESSGDPHLSGRTAVPVDADHQTICKFSTRDDPTYLQALQFITSCIGVAERQSAQPSDDANQPAPHQSASSEPEAADDLPGISDAPTAIIIRESRAYEVCRSAVDWLQSV